MKIALLGYGKMGKTIEKLTMKTEDEIVFRLNKENASSFDTATLAASGAEVAIDFSRPDSAFNNISTAIDAGIPVVSGTTAWLDKLPEVQSLCDKKGGAFFYASNFSLGVNIFFQINKTLAKLMDSQVDFDVRMKEIHHTEKLDAPSGTAITLAEDIISFVDRKKNWESLKVESPDNISIESIREAGVPGTHEVIWESDIDELKISHIAKSREGFAKGALLAAKWLPGKTGCFGMEDLLSF